MVLQKSASYYCFSIPSVVKIPRVETRNYSRLEEVDSTNNYCGEGEGNGNGNGNGNGERDI